MPLIVRCDAVNNINGNIFCSCSYRDKSFDQRALPSQKGHPSFRSLTQKDIVDHLRLVDCVLFYAFF